MYTIFTMFSNNSQKHISSVNIKEFIWILFQHRKYKYRMYVKKNEIYV